MTMEGKVFRDSNGREFWSVGDIAERAGRSTATVHRALINGLIPYEPGGKTASIPADIAEMVAQAIGAGLVNQEMAKMMRDEPARLVAELEVLTELARRNIADQAARQKTTRKKAA